MAGPRASIVNLSEVKLKLLRPALTSNFVCRFQPPDAMRSFLSNRLESNYFSRKNQELIELSCSEASLPGSSLVTNEINDDRTGVTERLAYRRQYDDRIDFTFYVDRDYTIISFFESWIAFCAGEDLQSDLVKKEYFYRVNYPARYQTDSLYVTKFEKDILSEFEYRFIDAYPISISSMPISYDSSELLKCTVSFSYIRYVIKKSDTELKRALTQDRLVREDNLRGATAAREGRGLEELNNANLEAFRRENPGVNI
jgi:thiol-disulfide isomerase/thioredoxin